MRAGAHVRLEQLTGVALRSGRGRMNTRLHVGNLSYNTSDTQLRELFRQAGSVKSVTRLVDKVTKLVRNYALIDMATAEEAMTAIRLLNGQMVDGHRIKVSDTGSRVLGPRRNARSKP